MASDTIIYVYPKKYTFVAKDILFLSKQFNVLEKEIVWEGKRSLPIAYLKQFFWLLFNLKDCSQVLVMFGGHWSLLPSILGWVFNTPVHIILGGTDCVSFPEINYGSLRKKHLKKVLRISYKYAKTLLPVDDSLTFYNYTYSQKYTYKKQGILYHFPDLKTPIHTIYNGFNPDVLSVEEEPQKIAKSFVVLASVSSYQRFVLKGLDRVFYLAKTYPDCRFSIIGLGQSFSQSLVDVPENVTLHAFMPLEQFKLELWKSQFVVQLSISEGFPNALCEAMLCKCIPIGSAVGAIPMIIDKTGFVVKNDTDKVLTEVVNDALRLTLKEAEELAQKARNRVVTEFSIERREGEFNTLLQNSGGRT